MLYNLQELFTVRRIKRSESRFSIGARRGLKFYPGAIMKKLVPPTVIALLLTALIVIPLRAANAQAGLVSSLLTKMERQRQSLKTLSADISMEKYNSQLRD